MPCGLGRGDPVVSERPMPGTPAQWLGEIRLAIKDARGTKQGQRSLNRCSGKDFQHEVIAPTATAAFHGHTVVTGMLLQQRQREAIEPCKVFTQVLIPNARLILAIGEIETPMTTVFNTPMTADRVGESLHAHRKTADVIANLNRLFPVAKALATPPCRSTSVLSTVRAPAGLCGTGI